MWYVQMRCVCSRASGQPCMGCILLILLKASTGSTEADMGREGWYRRGHNMSGNWTGAVNSLRLGITPPTPRVTPSHLHPPRPRTYTHPTFTPALITSSHLPIPPHIHTKRQHFHTLTPSHHLITFISHPLTLSHPHTFPPPSPRHPHTFPPTIPLSLRAVSMTITEMFCSHTICQNSPTVSTRGACATIYSGLDECVSYCKERDDTRVFTSWCDL